MGNGGRSNCDQHNATHWSEQDANPADQQTLPKNYCATTLARMLISEVFTAIFQLGLPVLLFSWWIMCRLYAAGQLSRDQPNKDTKSRLKALKKDWKKDDTAAGYVEKRWMKFGGGFYGLTALLTFVWIETADAVNFIVYFPGLAALFENGIIDLLIETLVSQIKNFVTAVVWVTYWPTRDGYIAVWILAPYAGYFAGLKLASRNLQAWRDLVKTKLSR